MAKTGVGGGFSTIWEWFYTHDHRGRYAHRVHRVSHRVRTACVLFITVSKIFSDFLGCQGRGGLRGKHTTTEASTPSSSPIAWWL